MVLARSRQLGVPGGALGSPSLVGGEEGSKALFMHLAPGEDPRHPEGSADNTHTRLPAARPFAAFVARQLEAL